MDAAIKISSSEFNEELFEKIKSLLKGKSKYYNCSAGRKQFF